MEENNNSETTSKYFIEKSGFDDSPDSDLNLGDDGVVIVDTQGYIVQP